RSQSQLELTDTHDALAILLVLKTTVLRNRRMQRFAARLAPRLPRTPLVRTQRLRRPAAFDMVLPMSAPHAKSATPERNGFVAFVRSEYPLFIGLATAVVLFATGNVMVEKLSNPLVLGVVFIWL